MKKKIEMVSKIVRDKIDVIMESVIKPGSFPNPQSGIKRYNSSS